MKSKLLLIILIVIGFLSPKIYAQGDLLITPNRVVFEGRKIKEELNLINTGNETTTFSVSFVQRRMNEDGSFENIEQPDPGQMFASPYLRIYPRQVTLQPGEAQVVMVQCTRRPNMSAAEYRSHLYFRSEKDYLPLGSARRESSNSVTVQLVPIFGMSIPIIIRSGDVNVSASISDIKLESLTEPSVLFTLNRSGNISIYGDVLVEFYPKQGKPLTVGAMKGVAIYDNLNRRFISMKLTIPPGTSLSNGILKVRYKSREDAIKQEDFAVAELNLVFLALGGK
jgi:hypothetical protein